MSHRNRRHFNRKKPHQGPRECARRLLQIRRQQLTGDRFISAAARLTAVQVR